MLQSLRERCSPTATMPARGNTSHHAMSIACEPSWVTRSRPSMSTKGGSKKVLLKSEHPNLGPKVRYAAAKQAVRAHRATCAHCALAYEYQEPTDCVRGDELLSYMDHVALECEDTD